MHRAGPAHLQADVRAANVKSVSRLQNVCKVWVAGGQISSLCTYQPNDALTNLLARLVRRRSYDDLVASNIPEFERKLVHKKDVTRSVHGGQH